MRLLLQIVEDFSRSLTESFKATSPQQWIRIMITIVVLVAIAVLLMILKHLMII